MNNILFRKVKLKKEALISSSSDCVENCTTIKSIRQSRQKLLVTAVPYQLMLSTSSFVQCLSKRFFLSNPQISIVSEGFFTNSGQN